VPGYRSIDRARFDLRRVEGIGEGSVPIGSRREPWVVEGCTLSDTEVEVLCVGGRYFDREGIYTDRAPVSSRGSGGALDLLLRAALGPAGPRPAPDVLHLNDHHTVWYRRT